MGIVLLELPWNVDKMVSNLRINEITTPNSFYRHIFPWRAKYRGEIRRSDKGQFIPIESKGSENLVKVDDLFKNPTDEQRGIFNDKWISQIISEHGGIEKYQVCKFELEKSGLTSEEAISVLDFSVNNARRAKDWAIDNEKKGKIASNYMNVAIILGLIRNLVMDTDRSDVSVFENLINIAFGFTSGMRGYYQYSLYGRDDDEAAMNIYQSDIYGNKIAGFLGKSAVFCETKLNPFILTLSGLLPARYQDPVFGLALLPNLLWWRSRMPAHLNQEYLSDIGRWLIHKPLSLLGRQQSIEEIAGIKKRGNLNWDYFLKRHCENIGLKDKKEQNLSNFVYQLFRHIKNSFSKDPEIQEKATKKVGQTIASILGVTAVASCGVGILGRSIFKMVGIKNRIFDFLAALGNASQQTIYFFKMVLPTFTDIKKLRKRLNEEKMKENSSQEEINNINNTANKKNNLFKIGLLCFLTNVINPFLKLLKIEGKILNKIFGIVNMLADNLVAKFFSERRHVNGYNFRATNQEFYKV